MTGRARWSSGNCARSLNLTIRIDGKCTTRNPSKKMWRTKFSGILRYKQIIGLTTRHRNYKKTKQNKTRSWRIEDFAAPSDYRIKLMENEILLKNWKGMEHEGDGNTNCNWRTRFSQQRLDTRTGGLGNKRMSGDHPNYYIVEIDQNTKKSLGD